MLAGQIRIVGSQGIAFKRISHYLLACPAGSIGRII